MNPLYFSVWSTILRVAATECNSHIASFTDPAQAMRHRQNATGTFNQVITNDEKWYWLVSATVAARLCASNFYPVPDDN